MFVPHSNLDVNVIFDELNISSLSDLFNHIPDELLIKDGLDVDESLSELEATKYFEDIGNKNVSNLVCFAGGGHYDVYLPAYCEIFNNETRVYDLIYTLSS